MDFYLVRSSGRDSRFQLKVLFAVRATKYPGIDDTVASPVRVDPGRGGLASTRDARTRAVDRRQGGGLPKLVLRFRSGEAGACEERRRQLRGTALAQLPAI